jgi:hypothetical protein
VESLRARAAMNNALKKLFLGLPWRCAPPVSLADGTLEWTFSWVVPVPDGQPAPSLVPGELKLVGEKSAVSFETLSAEIERYIGSEPGLICECCALEHEAGRCAACMYAVGFHTCQKNNKLKWKKGTLYGGVMDFQRVLFNLHRRGVPTERLKEKADEYVLNGDLSLDMGKAIIATIESERGKQRLVNGAAGADDDADNGRISDKLTLADMQAELDKRVELMRAGAAGDGITDQARVFDYIVSQLEGRGFLRLMVQASAGTGNQGRL